MTDAHARDGDENAPPRLALVGVPNCGKTALFNAMTGSRQKVGNYAGVTVERKTGLAVSPARFDYTVIDLPGTYSLRARSPDEEITRDVLLGRRSGEGRPDLIVAVADATNMRSAIRLVLELQTTGIPVLLVLNMIDIALRRGVEIDLDQLSAALQLPVVTASAVQKNGLSAVWDRLDGMRAEGWPALLPGSWHEPGGTELRARQRRADEILRHSVTVPPKPDTLTNRLDAVLLHPVWGLLSLLVLLFVMFQAVFSWAQPMMDLIGFGFDSLGAALKAGLGPGLVESFLVDGVIAGVGSVVTFLPQILILFLFILLLEDFGYMARAAFLMDRIMGGAGLHGRAFIPLLSSFACAIPGIMATRVIDNRRDRLTTILVAPLMTCSARIPVYTLIISAFIPARPVLGLFSLQGLVMFGLYAMGILSALAVSFIAKVMVWYREPAPTFMLELPDYKLPRARNVLRELLNRASQFLKRAGTTILSMAILMWFLASFPTPPDGASGPAILHSYAAMIGSLIEPLLRPIGFNWQMSVALVPGIAAREVVVAALGTVYSVQGAGDPSTGIASLLAQQWSLATALSFLAWYIFAPQCLSTLAVIRRETGASRYVWISFFYMLALAYAASFITYQLTLLFQ